MLKRQLSLKQIEGTMVQILYVSTYQTQSACRLRKLRRALRLHKT